MSAPKTLADPPIILSYSIPASATCCDNCGAKLDHHIDISAASEAQVALLDAQRHIADLENRLRHLQSLLPSPPASPRPANKMAQHSRNSSANYSLFPSGSPFRMSSGSTASPRLLPEAAVTRPETPKQQTQTHQRSVSSSWGFGTGKLSSLLSRKSTPNIRLDATDATPDSPPLPTAKPSHLSAPPPVTKDMAELMAALDREQELRVKAEGKLNETSKEVEELSVALFEQANEMVAEERRARARLEQRVSVLEKRDVEKKDRLQRLEGAMEQIHKVKVLLGEVTPEGLPIITSTPIKA